GSRHPFDYFHARARVQDQTLGTISLGCIRLPGLYPAGERSLSDSSGTFPQPQKGALPRFWQDTRLSVSQSLHARKEQGPVITVFSTAFCAPTRFRGETAI